MTKKKIDHREEDQRVTHNEGGKSKRPYSPPRLVTYGDFEKITMAKGGLRFDGGSVNSKV
jgi:hypothetical protein